MGSEISRYQPGILNTDPTPAPPLRWEGSLSALEIYAKGYRLEFRTIRSVKHIAGTVFGIETEMLHLQPQHKVHRDGIPVQALREILLVLPVKAIAGLDAAIDVEVQHRSHFEAPEKPLLERIIAISERHGQTKHLDAREIRIAAL